MKGDGMIDRIMWIDTENTYPYRNLAMEEYMTCLLYTSDAADE